MNTVETLEAAKNELIEHGWVQGAYRMGKRHCLIGAIAEAKKADAAETESCLEVFIVERAVGWDRNSNGDGYSIAMWNDHPGRTFNDVMDAFDAAILRAKERESSA